MLPCIKRQLLAGMFIYLFISLREVQGENGHHYLISVTHLLRHQNCQFSSASLQQTLFSPGTHKTRISILMQPLYTVRTNVLLLINNPLESHMNDKKSINVNLNWSGADKVPFMDK